MALALALPASAQDWRGPFGVRVQIGRDVDRLIRQAENHTSQLAAMLDERERYGLSRQARDLENQLNIVGAELDRRSNYYQRRSAVEDALNVAQGINSAMRYRRVDYDVQRQWAMVRYDLNRLARAFNLRQLS
jgi:hypothetical protein